MLLSSDKNVKIEHEAVRNTAGWYYFTHQLLEITGLDAVELLDQMCTNTIYKTGVGRAKYTTILDEDGLIIDDVIIFRMEENKFWLSTLHIGRSIKWLEAHKAGRDVAYRNITKEWDMYSVQGPRSRDLVNAVAEQHVDDMKFFSITDNKIGGISVKIARSGYTGEKLGYEIYVNPSQKEVVENALSEKQDDFGALRVTEIDVMAYTLPTEKGFVLITDICGCNPFEVGMDKTIGWEKNFTGKAALEAIKDQPLKRQLIGLQVDDPEARVYGGPKGAPITKNGELVGRVTKFTYGATVGKNIGFALVDTEKASVGDRVILNNDTEALLTERPILK